MTTLQRTRPNILITGTPGTGKSTLSELVAMAAEMTHLNCSQIVKEQKLHSGYDESFDTYTLDEDKLCDFLEPLMQEGGQIVDLHSCDFFPERWFDLVIVLTTENSVLYDRLSKRGYSQKKITENIECEIMQVVVEEAKESYRADSVHIFCSNTVDDMESNVERIQQWIDQWS